MAINVSTALAIKTEIKLFHIWRIPKGKEVGKHGKFFYLSCLNDFGPPWSPRLKIFSDEKLKIRSTESTKKVHIILAALNSGHPGRSRALKMSRKPSKEAGLCRCILADKD
ncbi:Uncharacterized protein TCM_000912 [Theobroma cacao]|uniref:Uncharacterized protein n=1 Tax=Theobroma cacao TaxID=3641 RepID=A0A061DPG1_THECC|nr:Uncharacterized protein TCM_000912 [Theobroma cacao]